MNQHDFSKIPAKALCFSGGEVSIGDNGEGAKTAPVKLKARSGMPIEHWYWGKVVHDLSGMRTHKSRLTIDYAHNDSEVLGYLNHFDASSGDLVVSGALTPFKDDDRASEVLYKMKQGVPYEASIFFGGDGIKIEEVGEGFIQTVNGRQFEGPGVIIREWPLRGVAICPYGADQNTESATFASGQTFSAVKIEQRKDNEMSEVAAVEAKTEAEGKPVESPVVEAEVKPQEVSQQAAQLAIDGKNIESLSGQLSGVIAERDAFKKQHEEISESLKAAESKAMLAAEIAEQKIKDALNRAEIAENKLKALEAGAPPLSHAPANEGKAKTPCLFKTGK